ncbi:MAG: hypothetical protein KGL53_06855 [Elusimicrobia bacterium]|nr:hypothetical protein [Elusimicrobiota bacterium]
MAGEPDKKPDPFKIRVADLSSPARPFESRPGAFHPYTYVPFLGWLPQTEFMVLVAFLGVMGACTVPLLAKAARRRAEAADRRALAEVRKDAADYAAGRKALPALDLRPWHLRGAASSTGAEPGDTGGWRFSGSRVYVDCTHTDSRGTAWTSY